MAACFSPGCARPRALRCSPSNRYARPRCLPSPSSLLALALFAARHDGPRTVCPRPIIALLDLSARPRFSLLALLALVLLALLAFALLALAFFDARLARSRAARS